MDVITRENSKDNFAKVLREYRKSKGLTYDAMAEKLGFKYQRAYARLETQQPNPKLNMLVHICTVFPDFPVDRILPKMKKWNNKC